MCKILINEFNLITRYRIFWTFYKIFKLTVHFLLLYFHDIKNINFFLISRVTIYMYITHTLNFFGFVGFFFLNNQVLFYLLLFNSGILENGNGHGGKIISFIIPSIKLHKTIFLMQYKLWYIFLILSNFNL